MGVPGIIVARTDAESATLLDGRSDDRDQPFMLGATHLNLPTFRTAFLAILRQFRRAGVEELSGHELYAICEEEYAAADAWLARFGFDQAIQQSAAEHRKGGIATVDAALDRVFDRFVDVWQEEAGICTYAEAVGNVIAFRESEGEHLPLTRAQWKEFAARAPFYQAREKARALGVHVPWDCEHAKTPDGYYQVRAGIDYAIAKSLAAAPFADLLWMETKTADLKDAKRFSDAIHAVFPDKMLAYNLSPSFNWDTTGMNDEQMRRFPDELGKMGFVFNFITYGGHQIDGLASEEFANALRQDGMLALARLQRKFRLLESGYRTPQTLVGGPRADAALLSISGRTSTTKAMGQGSTQHQHLVQTEVPPKVLEEWLDVWRAQHGVPAKLRVQLKPHTSSSDLLELALFSADGEKKLNIIFAHIEDRRGRAILSVRDQNNFDLKLRKKRLMTLVQLFLFHRYKVDSAHYVTPTEDNQRQAEGMKSEGLFNSVVQEVGEIIVADVNKARVQELAAADRKALQAFVARK
jgi:isocitrate lyase